jgi:hypothetical protein
MKTPFCPTLTAAEYSRDTIGYPDPIPCKGSACAHWQSNVHEPGTGRCGQANGDNFPDPASPELIVDGYCPCGGKLEKKNASWAMCPECGDDTFPITAEAAVYYTPPKT